MPTARAAALVLLLAALAPPAGAADPALLDPRGLPGALVIAGDSDKVTDDARKAFFDLAGKDKAKIVVLAAGAKTGEADLKFWRDLKPQSAELLVARDRKQADDATFAKPLDDATAVWITGIPSAALLDVYRGTATEKAVAKVHARGGVIGGATPSLAQIVLDGGPGPITDRPGFGFLPGFTFNFGGDVTRSWKPLAKALAARPGFVGIAMDSGSALVVRGRVMRVIGDAPIAVCVAKGAGKPAANDEYKAGSLLDLVQLQRAALNRAAKEPFPPAKPPVPEVKKGTLVLAGGGAVPETVWKRFIELAGGPESTIVVVTGTMENSFEPEDRRRPIKGLFPSESAEEIILKECGAKNVVALHTRDHKRADDPKFSDALLGAKGVWFGSGRQWAFVDSYEGTLAEKRFREVLTRGGVIGGGSAGASVQSEFMPRGHPLGNTVMAAEGYERGFGFLPGCAVDQHFFARKRMGDMTALMKEYPQYLGIGIDEGTAIVVKGSVAEVIGRTKVAFYDTTKKPDGDKDYEEVLVGEKYDLKERKKVK